MYSSDGRETINRWWRSPRTRSTCSTSSAREGFPVKLWPRLFFNRWEHRHSSFDLLTYWWWSSSSTSTSSSSSLSSSSSWLGCWSGPLLPLHGCRAQRYQGWKHTHRWTTTTTTATPWSMIFTTIFIMSRIIFIIIIINLIIVIIRANITIFYIIMLSHFNHDNPHNNDHCHHDHHNDYQSL